MASTDTAQEIGKVVIDQIGSQIDLATTLATAIAGGIIALVIQIGLHNAGEHKVAVRLACSWLIAAALLVEGLSLVFGYFAKSAVTGAAPIIFQIPIEIWNRPECKPKPPCSFSNVSFAGDWELGYLVTLQSACMFLGLACVAVLAMKNLRRLLRGAGGP